jgi:hypothetical protein
MKPGSAVGAAFLLSLLLAAPAVSQTGLNEQAARGFFLGQRLQVTYREGGAQYGTFYFLQVHFCRSGRYMTTGQSRRHTVLDNEQISNFSDQGAWDITTFQGQLFLKYLSDSGQANALPVRLLPNGSLSLGDGISLVKEGPAQCR